MNHECSVEGCGKKIAGRGLCSTHYYRLMKFGDPGHNPRDAYRASCAGRTCQVPGCAKPPRSIGSTLCEMHYYRARRHGGDPGHTEFDGIAISTNGYRMVRDARHPLSHAEGYVYEHRAVLYAKIGPGTHRCHWCDTPVSWDRKHPIHPDALTVDHVDADKLNNSPGNLVPSCGPCNAARANLQRTHQHAPCA